VKQQPEDWLVGKSAPPLALPHADTGDSVSLAAYRGRPVLITFLSHAA